MANEATPITLYGENGSGKVASYTCAAGKTISKGTLLVLVGNSVVSAHSTLNEIPIGIAAMTKDGTDPSTTISVWQDGEFSITASETLVLGGFVKLAGAGSYNMIINCTNADQISWQRILGTTLEATAAGSTGRVRINF